MSCLVALEGVVHAGKSTIISLLQEIKGILCIPEYIEFVESFPGFPNNKDDVLRSWKFFLDIELRRKRFVVDGFPSILDRSVLSVMAYNYAVSRFTNGKINWFDVKVESLREEGWLIPDICIYLDISDKEVARRHEMETGGYKDILLNNQFNGFIRDFYANEVLRIFPSMSMFQINAHDSIEDVFLEVVRVIFTL